MRDQIAYPLRAAATGYKYQDLVGAVSAARVLLRRTLRLSVETKLTPADPFDDLSILSPAGRTRVQIKHSSLERILSESDFKTGTLKLNSMVEAHIADRASELRLVATWAPPSSVPWLVRAEGFSVVSEEITDLYRFDANEIWPENATCAWDGDNLLDRDDFLSFCDRFSMELSAEPMSGTVGEPGPLERRLLSILRDDVGVELHPNRADAMHVAGLLCEMVAGVRTKGPPRELEFEGIAQYLNLVVDRGRLPQAFPLDAQRFVDRSDLSRALDAELATHAKVIVVGEPGIGKSWALEAYVEKLRVAGQACARHYCFLEPGDIDLSTRATVNAMWANLASELLDDDRLADLNVGLGVDREEFERILAEAVEVLRAGIAEKRPALTLVVDGLDHVARVDHGAHTESPEDFVMALNALQLPDGVRLIVSGQPGDYWGRFEEGVILFQMSPLSRLQIARQMARLGVFKYLRGSGRELDRTLALESMEGRTQGSPLLVRYFSLELIDALTSDHLLEVDEALDTAIGGAQNLAAYYDHLLGGGSGFSRRLISLLAVIDFSVTTEELAEIFPGLGRDLIGTSLREVSPVLSTRAKFGGWRIVHESLRRHVLGKALDGDDGLDDLLGPAILWLSAMGHFDRTIAYRELPRCLVRAGRPEAALDLLTDDYVARSAMCLHGPTTISRNLNVFAQACVDLGDLPRLAQVAELHRAAAWIDEEAYSEDFARLFASLEGPATLAERIVSDGKPVFEKLTGLRICGVVDELGGSAPWGVYVDAQSDQETFRSAEERRDMSLLELRGALRISGGPKALNYVLRWASESEGVDSNFAFQVAEILRKFYGADGLTALLKDEHLNETIRGPVRLSLAQHSLAEGRTEPARELSNLATPELPVSLIRLALDSGADKDQVLAALGDSTSVMRRVTTQRGPSIDAVQAFTALVQAQVDDEQSVDGMRIWCDGVGWYRAWLRFVIDSTIAGSDQQDLVDACLALAQNTDPFLGEPRAVDLYSAQPEITRFMGEVLGRLDPNELAEVAEAFLAQSTALTRYLNGAPSGPVELSRLLRAMPDDPTKGTLLLLEKAVRADTNPEYYGTHAAQFVSLALLFLSSGEIQKAKSLRDDAGRFIAAHGMRKDVTVFSFIESLDAFPESEGREVGRRARLVQDACDAAYAHSDGSETAHLNDSWIAMFAGVEPASAARCVADTILVRSRVPRRDWDFATRKVVENARGSQPPEVLHGILRGLPARNDVELRLEVLGDLLANKPSIEIELNAAIAAIVGDDREVDRTDLERIRQWCSERGFDDRASDLCASEDRSIDGTDSFERNEESVHALDVLRAVANHESLIRWLRTTGISSLERSGSRGELPSVLAQVVSDIDLSSSEIVDLVSLLRTRNPYTDLGFEIAALAQLVAGSDASICANLYVQAWFAARESWVPFGGMARAGWLRAAAASDPTCASNFLLSEFATELIEGGSSNGMSQRLVEAQVCFGDFQSAFDTWDSGFSVVRYRLPEIGWVPNAWISPPDWLSEEEQREAFFLLLFAMLRNPNMDRRTDVIAAIGDSVDRDPAALVGAFRRLLSADSTVDEIVVLLHILEIHFDRAAELAEELRDLIELATLDPAIGVSVVARRLANKLSMDAPGAVQVPAVRRLTAGEHQLDLDQQLSSAELIVPNVRALATARFIDLGGNERRNQQVDESQASTQFSRSATWVPPTHLWRWRQSLLFTAIQDVSAESMFLAGSGSSDEIARRLGPDTALAIARANSRIPRPDLSLLGDISTGDQDVMLLSSGPFDSWAVLALWEDELREGTKYDEGLKRSVLVGSYRGPSAPKQHALFGRAEHSWFYPAEGQSFMPALLGGGKWNVQGLATHDALAWDRYFVLDDQVRKASELTFGPVAKGMTLVDVNSEAAVVWRHWRERPFNLEYGPETPMFRGGALLCRQDLLSSLAGSGRRCKVTIQERTLLQRVGE